MLSTRLKGGVELSDACVQEHVDELTGTVVAKSVASVPQ